MALCRECGTALPGSTMNCPTCGASRRRTAAVHDPAAVPHVSFPELQPEIGFAEVRLVTNRPTGKVGPDRLPSWVSRKALALVALVLGIASVVLGLLWRA
jgi:hypothetical protein